MNRPPRTAAEPAINPSQPILIEIPAREFTNPPLSTASASPPPARICTPPRYTTRSWHKRLDEAAAARSASLEVLRVRCKHHVDHVVSVARVVKAERRATSAARHAQLSSSLAEANARRGKVLAARAADAARARAHRARVAREREQKQRRADARAAQNARDEAGKRRGRLLSAKKDRAARFSPTKRLPMSPLMAFGPGPRRESFSSSSCSLSTASLDGERMYGSSGRTDCTGNYELGLTGCLPKSVADNHCNMDCASSGRKEKAFSTKEISPQKDLRFAARKVASYYLLRRARSALTSAGVLGMQLGSYSFAETMEHLKGSKPQEAVELVFRALGMRKNHRSLTNKVVSKERGERRVMLSCLLLALHPESVVDDWRRGSRKGGAEAIIDSTAVYCGRRMLLCLHAGTLDAIAYSWMSWRRAFLIWKKKDSANLLNAMIKDAIATDEIRAAIDRRLSEAGTAEEIRTSLNADSTAAELQRAQHAVWEEQINQKQRKIREAIVKLAGRDGEQKLNSALSASRSFRDERMLHEIMVDLPGLFERIEGSTSVPNDSWKQLHAELSMTPPSRNELVARLSYMSKSLNSMIPGSFSLSNYEAPEELDRHFAVRFVSQVCDALRRCQSEACDEALSGWLKDATSVLTSANTPFVDAVVQVLKELTDFIDRVHTDVLTFRIRGCVPIVREFGPAWERSRFDGHIAAGVFAKELPKTKRLLELARGPMEETGAFWRHLKEYPGRSLRYLLVRSLMRLVMKQDVCASNELPEVMHLDVERIISLQNKAQKCSLVGSLDNIGKQFLRTKSMMNTVVDPVELLKILDKDDTRLPNVQDSFVNWIEGNMRAVNFFLADHERSFLRGMVQRVIDSDDKTFALIRRRVERGTIELCDEMLLDGMDCPARPTQISSMQSLTDLGLHAVKDVVYELSKAVADLVVHLVAVHGERLETLSRALMP